MLFSADRTGARKHHSSRRLLAYGNPDSQRPGNTCIKPGCVAAMTTRNAPQCGDAERGITVPYPRSLAALGWPASSRTPGHTPAAKRGWPDAPPVRDVVMGQGVRANKRPAPEDGMTRGNNQQQAGGTAIKFHNLNPKVTTATARVCGSTRGTQCNQPGQTGALQTCTWSC